MVSEFEQRRMEHERRMKEINRGGIVGAFVFLSVWLGVVGGLVCIVREARNRSIEECVQLSEQQNFSRDFCSDNCFRDTYFELQRKYKVDLGLAYRIAANKCRGNH